MCKVQTFAIPIVYIITSITLGTVIRGIQIGGIITSLAVGVRAF